MKLYISLFLASASLPLASLVTYLAFEMRIVRTLPETLGVGFLSISALLAIAMILFLWSIPGTRKRLNSMTAPSV